MKQTNGTPFNIETDILGRITLKDKCIFNRKDEILVKADATSVPSGYSAVITNSETINGSKPCVGNVQMLDEFNEGDVVLINKRGEIVFLYEIKSMHNAIFATERCNHRCIMCPQPPVAEEEDKTPFNLKLISLIDKNTVEVGITGGEPTLIGDKLFELIRQIQKYQPKAGISLLTNGVKFADKEYALKLALCKHRDLQIDVPIFSDIADEHNRIVGAKTFYKTVQGLYNLALFHQRIGLRIVVHKQTYKRLPQLADYIYHNFPFVSQVAFLQMETTGNANTNLDELWIDPYDYNEELKQAVLLLANRGICTRIYNAQLCVLPHEIREFAVNSISDWKDTYLPECEGCKLREKCGGLFESNQKHHSRHIKPELKYTPMPQPSEGDETISAFLKNKLTEDILCQYHSPIIFDVPCGYGRHLKWLSKLGYEVSGFDLDPKAIHYLEEWVKKDGMENVHLSREDIDTLPSVNCCDIMINVHLYSVAIMKKLSSMVKTNGLFVMETPEIHGENGVELPKQGEVKQYLISQGFEFLYYSESSPHNGIVSVKTIAKKMA